MAAAAVTTLAPALRHLLKKGGERAADEAGSRLGVEAWDAAKTLWAKLGPRIEASSSALATAQKVAANPDDEDLKAALRVYLREILNEDSNLRDEVTQIVGSNIQHGDTNIMTRDAVIDSTIIGRVVSSSAADHAQRLPKNPVARVVLLLGGALCLTGLGIFFFSMITLMAKEPGADGDVPLGIPVAFGVFFIGFVLVAVGGVFGQLTAGQDE